MTTKYRTRDPVEVMKACLAEVGLNPDCVGLAEDGHLQVTLGWIGGEPGLERDRLIWRAFNLASPDTTETCFDCFQMRAGHGPCASHSQNEQDTP